MGRARVLFLENQDSFSWNVVDCLPFARDEVDLVDGRRAAADPRRLDGARALVVGPGPGDPWRHDLVGLVRHAVERGIPTLGICLGHQALGLAFGATLVRVAPMHGKTSPVRFSGSRFFGGFAGPQVVMRYHSLAVSDVPEPLRVVATTADGVVMALEHATRPAASLQFHPDSFATPAGPRMVASFFEAVA